MLMIEPGLIGALCDEVSRKGVFELFLVLERVVNLRNNVDIWIIKTYITIQFRLLDQKRL